MIKIIIWLLLSILSGIAYRLGGIGKPFKSWMRDGICPLIALVALWLLVGFKSSYWWAYLLTFGLMWGALSTYWRLDEKRWGYWAHGLGISISALPIIFITGNWLGFIIRCIVLTGLITIVSKYITKDWLEEGLRGFLTIATLPLLLI